ncbi:MAG TPA: 16S rRNA (guanine(527)-N(7))-methyltransferase RsmG [Bacteroidales bacterium]|nr:16S rRNA (guanine(527)-N(7))-methyltransferase RsmG [Bacteroidales bacterium]
MISKIVEKILFYFPNINKCQQEKLSLLYDIYFYWNQRINLISRKDFPNFYEHHVLHSLALTRFLNTKTHKTVLDVGTGGGFPGIPLAILFPNTHFFLLDSIQKKLMVVNEIISSVKLYNVTTIRQRIETHQTEYDCVLGRAVKNLNQFIGWTKKNVKPNGTILYLSGGDITYVPNLHIKIFNIAEIFSEPFFESKKIIQIYF